MKSSNPPLELGFCGRLLAGMGEGVPDALVRVGIGFVTLPLNDRLRGDRESYVVVLTGLVMVLILLRVVPVVIRKLTPFSRPLQLIWSNRRQLAKRYDSYQWRKLFWIAIGMAIYTSFPGNFTLPRITTSALCFFAGAVGLIRWRMVKPATQESPATGRHIPTVA